MTAEAIMDLNSECFPDFMIAIHCFLLSQRLFSVLPKIEEKKAILNFYDVGFAIELFIVDKFFTLVLKMRYVHEV